MKKARLVGVVIWTPERTVSVRAVDGVRKVGGGYDSGRTHGTSTYYTTSDGVFVKAFSSECEHAESGMDSDSWRADLTHDYDADAYNFFVRDAPTTEK